jgi:hypothetical protein
MADPTNKIPHLLGITLDSTGIATTIVVARNRTTGERQSKATDSGKIVIFDAANFTSGYSTSDVIEFENCGASLGGTTITINSATGGFQSATIICTVAPTGAIQL